MSNIIDQSGNAYINNLYIGDSNIVIDSHSNFYGNNAHLTNIKINNKKFVDIMRNVYASNITCGIVNSGEIKINGKTVIDKNGAKITGDIICNSDIVCDNNMFCNNLYMPVSNDNTLGRIRCSTLNTNNIIIPTTDNSFFANMDFSLVLNGTDGTITSNKLYSLNGFDTSGNINCSGNIVCDNFASNNIDTSGFQIGTYLLENGLKKPYISISSNARFKIPIGEAFTNDNIFINNVNWNTTLASDILNTYFTGTSETPITQIPSGTMWIDTFPMKDGDNKPVLYVYITKQVGDIDLSGWYGLQLNRINSEQVGYGGTDGDDATAGGTGGTGGAGGEGGTGGDGGRGGI